MNNPAIILYCKDFWPDGPCCDSCHEDFAYDSSFLTDATYECPTNPKLWATLCCRIREHSNLDEPQAWLAALKRRAKRMKEENKP